MQVIRDFLQHKLRFQKYYNESDFTERDLLNTLDLKPKRSRKARTEE